MKLQINTKHLTYIQSYHQLGHLDEKQKVHEQTPQNPGFHYVSYQTNQTPALHGYESRSPVFNTCKRIERNKYSSHK